MEISREDPWRRKRVRRDKRLRLELSRPELLHQRNQTFQHRECRGLLYRGETESRLQANKRTMQIWTAPTITPQIQPVVRGGIALQIKIHARQRSFIDSQEWSYVPKLWASIGARLSSGSC